MNGLNVATSGTRAPGSARVPATSGSRTATSSAGTVGLTCAAAGGGTRAGPPCPADQPGLDLAYRSWYGTKHAYVRGRPAEDTDGPSTRRWGSSRVRQRVAPHHRGHRCRRRLPARQARVAHIQMVELIMDAQPDNDTSEIEDPSLDMARTIGAA